MAGSENTLGAFVGDSCRGVGSPVQHNDGWLYFITVYANGEGETVNFKAWISDTDTVLGVWETIIFTNGFSLGGPDAPYELNTYLNYDFAPVVFGIPDQLIHQGESFDEVRLYDYLELNDSDPILWSVSGQQNLVVSLTDSIAVVSSVADTVKRPSASTAKVTRIRAAPAVIGAVSASVASSPSVGGGTVGGIASTDDSLAAPDA